MLVFSRPDAHNRKDDQCNYAEHHCLIRRPGCPELLRRRRLRLYSCSGCFPALLSTAPSPTLSVSLEEKAGNHRSPNAAVVKAIFPSSLEFSRPQNEQRVVTSAVAFKFLSTISKSVTIPEGYTLPQPGHFTRSWPKRPKWITPAHKICAKSPKDYCFHLYPQVAVGDFSANYEIPKSTKNLSYFLAQLRFHGSRFRASSPPANIHLFFNYHSSSCVPS